MSFKLQQKAYTSTFAIVGRIVHSEKLSSLTVIEDGFLVVVRGRIACVYKNTEKLEKVKHTYGIDDDSVYHLGEGEFVMPGFIDTHIHAPQYPNSGLGYDKELLDWLTTYTFPLENKYCDLEFANTVYESVVRRTLANGTTTATYFATIHNESSLLLADIVERLGQRAFIGKVNMNYSSPGGYGENRYESIENTDLFIRSVLCKKNELVQPIITPRFALSCDMNLMISLAEFAAKHNVHIQTHVSENKGEVAAVQNVYSEYKNYTDVYATAGLLTNKTILAHGVHLDDEELKVLAALGTSIAHCPNSNTSLKSGLCDVRRLLEAGVKVGLGTDISGGYSPSILNAIRSALQTSIHISFINGKDYVPLSYHEAFYLATLGGAKALSIEDKTGNFKVGKDFDAIVVNMNNSDILDKYDTKQLVEKFLYCGDDRNMIKVFVAGRQVK